MKFCVTLLLLTVIVEYSSSVRCPKIVGKYPFDETRFAGEWYFISGLAPPEATTNSCQKIQVNVDLENSRRGIIATDYDNFGVSVTCKTTFNAETKLFGRLMSAVIISRTRTLDRTILDTLKNFLTSYDIPLSDVTDINQTNC